VSSPSTGIDHGGLVKDDRTTSLIERLAEGVDVSIAPGIATSTAVCLGSAQIGPTTLRFSTHSPVALHVYDSAGRHTGPAADGTIELGIPGSSYTTLGENSFVFAPAGNTYRVVVDALAQGQFTLKAETLAGPNIIASTNYLNIPLAGAATVAEATFSNSGMDPSLSLDSNGDGTAEMSVPATAQLFDAVAADSEPPQIVFSGVPSGTIVAGTSFAVSFSASDYLSGVATTSATINGISFSSGAALTSPLVGRNVIIIQATDKAGNPKVLSAEFNQVSPPTQPAPSQQPVSGSSSQESSTQQPQSQERRSAGRTGSGNVLGASTTVSNRQIANGTSTNVSENPAACLDVPSESLGRGRSNDRAQVILLQAFLSRELKLSLPLTGFFGPITELAVKVFQLRHYADVLAPLNLTAPTGFVGKYTLVKIDALACT
jgi:hypothetical protein